MKNILFVLIIMFVTTTYSQSAKEMLLEIENKWKQDENGNVMFERIVALPNLSKEEIYKRALNYYQYHYGNAKALTQTKDDEKGLIVRKGMYENAHNGYNVMVHHLNIWHILTFQSKDNLAEITLTLTDYDQKVEKYLDYHSDTEKIYKLNVKDNYPINPNGKQKTLMTKTFHKAYKAAMESLDAIEKGIKE